MGPKSELKKGTLSIYVEGKLQENIYQNTESLNLVNIHKGVGSCRCRRMKTNRHKGWKIADNSFRGDEKLSTSALERFVYLLSLKIPMPSSLALKFHYYDLNLTFNFGWLLIKDLRSPCLCLQVHKLFHYLVLPPGQNVDPAWFQKRLGCVWHWRICLVKKQCLVGMGHIYCQRRKNLASASFCGRNKTEVSFGNPPIRHREYDLNHSVSLAGNTPSVNCPLYLSSQRAYA